MSARLRTLVVDDEPLARARLCRLLERAPDIDVIAQCHDGRSAILTTRAERPDVLFLDVQMPEVDGFAVLTALGAAVAPALIFVTAFDRYAVRAFDACAVDYLLKPFDAARLDRAVERARRQIAARALAPLAPRLEALLAAVQTPRAPERLAVPVGDRTEFVDFADIESFEAEGNYVAVRARGRSHLVRDTLAAMEARLSPRQFVRIHRSRIVRIDRVRAVEPLFHGEYRLTLDSGAELTSTRRYREALRIALGLAVDPAES